jgi:threonine dehydratase
MDNVTLASSVGREAIRATEAIIRPYIRRTPIVEVQGADFHLPGVRLNFKLELLQHSGSFKARGAFANLLLRDVPRAGVVAASGGNHGVAVAYAAQQLGRPARIFVPSIASPEKIERIRGFGAELVIAGALYADALEASAEYAASSGAMVVHAYDQRETLLGQGSLAMEWEELAELDSVLVAVGGGGLVGGMASWFGGRVGVIGVEPETAPTLSYALKAGKPVDSPAGGVAADSLAPKRVGELMFPIAQELLKKVVLVSDQAILAAQDALWKTMRVAAEPGGSAALAALLSGRYRPESGERVGVLVCGGNHEIRRG